MDMEKQAHAHGAARAHEGDLADVVARANISMPSSSPTCHHQPRPPPPPASAHTMVPYQEEPRQRPAMSGPSGVGDAASAMLESAVVVDPYLLAATGFGLPQHQHWQQLPFQISDHACHGHDLLVTAASAVADVHGDESMSISPPPAPPPHHHHHMITSDCGMPCAHIPYCRKNDVRKVVCIPAPPATNNRAGGGGEVIPSDLWAWRKYGQKPIKGSPYPRGYYRCSSSKGCMARKQVERSRSDPNMLVITYTAEHNHPWPMHRNVLAGYARAHTQAAAAAATAKKQQHHRINNNVASSSRTNNVQLEQTVIISGDHPGNHMMPVAAGDGVGAGCLMFDPSKGVQPDEVFAELEELEPDNSSMIVSANVYRSRGGP
uniref:Uncharacterized protein n=1 Tax=Avena sativa TaxID=4498 RepID=A0ACD5WEP4_AVESA